MFANLHIEGGSGNTGPAQVDCTAGRGGQIFSVPAPGGDDWIRVAAFQASAGGEPAIELRCSSGTETWDSDVVVYRATLTAVPRIG